MNEIERFFQSILSEKNKLIENKKDKTHFH